MEYVLPQNLNGPHRSVAAKTGLCTAATTGLGTSLAKHQAIFLQKDELPD